MEKNTELTHHGILGQKWGVRRYQNKDGSLTPAGKRRYSDSSPYEVKTADGDTFYLNKGSNMKYDPNLAKVSKTWGEHYREVDNKKLQKVSTDKQIKSERKTDARNRRTMPDADLQKRIQRFKLEKEFKQLTEEDITPGKKFVSEIISSGAKKALTITAAGAIGYGIKAVMTKEFDLKEAARYMAPNPNKKK